MTTITHIIALIIGVLMGAFVVYKFNPTDYKISGKYKAKKGSNMDITNNLKPKKERFKLFKNKRHGKF